LEAGRIGGGWRPEERLRQVKGKRLEVRGGGKLEVGASGEGSGCGWR